MDLRIANAFPAMTAAVVVVLLAITASVALFTVVVAMEPGDVTPIVDVLAAGASPSSSPVAATPEQKGTGQNARSTTGHLGPQLQPNLLVSDSGHR
ncbi:MAG TPA: hypothetical protein VMG61_00865 [Usitatibacter sp.]|nr:hypothetical protein [Usitatibacter sp.]